MLSALLVLLPQAQAIAWSAQGCQCQPQSEVVVITDGVQTQSGISHQDCGTGAIDQYFPQALGKPWCDTVDPNCNSGKGWDFCIPPAGILLNSRTTSSSQSLSSSMPLQAPLPIQPFARLPLPQPTPLALPSLPPQSTQAVYVGSPDTRLSFQVPVGSRDNILDRDCSSRFPGSVAATASQILTRSVANLPETQSSSYPVLLKCASAPECMMKPNLCIKPFSFVSNSNVPPISSQQSAIPQLPLQTLPSAPIQTASRQAAPFLQLAPPLQSPPLQSAPFLQSASLQSLQFPQTPLATSSFNLPLQTQLPSSQLNLQPQIQLTSQLSLQPQIASSSLSLQTQLRPAAPGPAQQPPPPQGFASSGPRVVVPAPQVVRPVLIPVGPAPKTYIVQPPGRQPRRNRRAPVPLVRLRPRAVEVLPDSSLNMSSDVPIRRQLQAQWPTLWSQFSDQCNSPEADGLQSFTLICVIDQSGGKVVSECETSCLQFDYDPVCALGITYDTVCEAQCARVSAFTRGACGQGRRKIGNKETPTQMAEPVPNITKDNQNMDIIRQVEMVSTNVKPMIDIESGVVELADYTDYEYDTKLQSPIVPLPQPTPSPTPLALPPPVPLASPPTLASVSPPTLASVPPLPLKSVPSPTFAPTYPLECYCDRSCVLNGDCCTDWNTPCPETPSPTLPPSWNGWSCEGSCGGKSLNGPCYCDSTCSENGDCCPNYKDECGFEQDGSCQNRCGFRSGTCWCDLKCETRNATKTKCCPDFKTVYPPCT